MNASTSDKLSAIDLAIAAARARKAAKVSMDDESSPFESAPKASKPRAPKATTERPAKADKPAKRAAKVVDEDVAAAKSAAREQAAVTRKAKQDEIVRQREERKAARETERQAKAAAKPVRKTAHMKKVEKAAAALPRLNGDAQLQVNDIVANFSAEQITAIALHLQHHNRVSATERSVTVSDNLNIGDTVRILGGDPRYIGMTGTVDTVRRIRCFVEVPGVRKPVYCFITDVELVAAASTEEVAEAV